jgi:hypothetical protein
MLATAHRLVMAIARSPDGGRYNALDFDQKFTSAQIRLKKHDAV